MSRAWPVQNFGWVGHSAFGPTNNWPVCSLKKPGLDIEELSNYRPISNLTTFSKVLERLALSRLRPHLLQSPNFSRFQSAYRHCHSTETALIHVMNQVYSAADSKSASILVGLDLTAAFDTIHHDELIKRLCVQFGVCDIVSTWLHSYLVGRQQSTPDSSHG